MSLPDRPKCDDMSILLDTIPALDGRTDLLTLRSLRQRHHINLSAIQFIVQEDCLKQEVNTKTNLRTLAENEGNS